jgi:hypothetical protein
MTNSTTTKYSAIFLAVILVAGTIATFTPSFMVGTAQAQPYYGMDSDRESDRKSVNVSSLKCNNINVNVNGLELDVFPSFLGGGEGLAAETQDANTDASSFAGNGPNGGSEINDFRFICINNNNNTVIEEEEPIPPIPPTPTCDDCFAALPPAVQAAVTNVLETIPPEGLPQDTTPPVTIPTTVGSIPELCDFLEMNILNVTPTQQQSLIQTFAQVEGSNIQIATALIECLIEAGIVNVISG